MLEVHGNSKRVQNSDVIFRDGEFAYKLDVEWAKWPEHLVGCPVAGGCCDKDDNIWVTTRWNDHPIILLDKDGNYVKEIGKGLFSNLHGIYVTPNDTLLCADASVHHVVREITFDGAVSYTHLDVYKRQALPGGGRAGAGHTHALRAADYGRTRLRHADGGLRLRFRLRSWHGGAEAGYEHKEPARPADVYKRQGRRHSPTPSPGTTTA